MEFKTVQEAFNYWNNKSIKEIEERSQVIKNEVETNPNADINVLNIEVEGMKQAKENLEEKRNAIFSFNPIAGNKKNNDEGDSDMSKDIFSSEEYRTAFYKKLLGHELNDIETRAMETADMIIHSEKRLDPFNTVTTNAQVIPTLTLNEIVRKARVQGGLLQEARSFNIPSNLKVPVGTPLTKAEWHTEGQKVSGEQNTPTAVEFNANELIKLFTISAKAKKMSISAFEAYITEELVNSVMEAIEQSLVSGNGTGQGKGLETISFTESNQVEYGNGSVPAYTDFTKVVGLLKRGYSKGAKWAMNNATLYNKVYSVVDGNKRPLFIADPKGESIGKILGFDIVIDDNIADGDIYLGNYNYLGYNIPDGVALEVSTEAGFDRGLIAYRALAIADTQVILPEAFVKLSESE